MRHAQWEVVGANDDMVFIEDLNRVGYPSITNDAEWVYQQVRNSTKNSRRVVYLDTDETWWELLLTVDDVSGQWRIAFRPWHGEVWDKLTR